MNVYNAKRRELRPVIWIGSARADLRAFPERVRHDAGVALYAAQQGETDPAAKPLKGFRGASVMEIVLSHDKNAYRVIYAISSKVISVLHAFQKKSKKGASTPRLQIEMIKRRLTVVQEYSNE